MCGCRPKSELGQKATPARRYAMSVLLPGADMPVTGRFAPEAASRKSSENNVCFSHRSGHPRQISHVREVPTADIAPVPE